jgi:hypothetical protein
MSPEALGVELTLRNKNPGLGPGFSFSSAYKHPLLAAHEPARR